MGVTCGARKICQPSETTRVTQVQNYGMNRINQFERNTNTKIFQLITLQASAMLVGELVAFIRLIFCKSTMFTSVCRKAV